MGWLRLVGSLKLLVSFAEYSLFHRASVAKEIYYFKESANRSHPISVYMCLCICICMCVCAVMYMYIVCVHNMYMGPDIVCVLRMYR